MELKITGKKDNKLLSRAEITAEMTHEGPTPNYDAVKKALANQLKLDESLIAIKHVYSNFGESRIKIIANVYDNKEAAKKIEPVKKEKKKPAGEEAEEAEKPAKAAEKPAKSEKPGTPAKAAEE